MHIFQLGNSIDLAKARIWWKALEMQWKMAYNEAVFGKGPTIEPPKDEELVTLLLRADALRFAGPMATAPNLSHSLSNLSGIAELTHLTYLSFTHSKITTIKEIENLTRLRSLFVYNNDLISLEGIEKMKDLQELYCLQNQISSIEPIRELRNLQTFYINYNKITNLNGLTEGHSDKLRNFYVVPNDSLPHREIIRVQNEYGILCRSGG